MEAPGAATMGKPDLDRAVLVTIYCSLLPPPRPGYTESLLNPLFNDSKHGYIDNYFILSVTLSTNPVSDARFFHNYFVHIPASPCDP